MRERTEQTDMSREYTTENDLRYALDRALTWREAQHILGGDIARLSPAENQLAEAQINARTAHRLMKAEKWRETERDRELRAREQELRLKEIALNHEARRQEDDHNAVKKCLTDAIWDKSRLAAQEKARDQEALKEVTEDNARMKEVILRQATDLASGNQQVIREANRRVESYQQRIEENNLKNGGLLVCMEQKHHKLSHQVKTLEHELEHTRTMEVLGAQHRQLQQQEIARLQKQPKEDPPGREHAAPKVGKRPLENDL